MPTLTPSPVTGIAAADPAAALDHFEKLLAFETDCWDVHAALAAGQQDFVLLDVRSPEAYQQGHVPGAVNLPHRRIVERTLSDFPKDALFVVYCDGPHCNGADKAALRLGELGRRVKIMIGGTMGWADEGFTFAEGADDPRPIGG